MPPYDANLLVDTNFRTGRLIATAPASREKGWRAHPLAAGPAGLQVRSDTRPAPHARLEIGSDSGKQVTVSAGAKLLLAQEIRSARGGHYTFRARLSGEETSAELFERWFRTAFRCRLVLLRFANTDTNALEGTELASEMFQPELRDFANQAEYSVSKFLGSTIPGTNFPIGNGLCVALAVECMAPLEIAAGQSARLCVHSAQLEFNLRTRDDSVTV